MVEGCDRDVVLLHTCSVVVLHGRCLLLWKLLNAGHGVCVCVIEVCEERVL